MTFFKTPQQRAEDKQRKRDQWELPLSNTGQRMRAWFDMLFIDHGVVRMVYLNRRTVTADLQRSAQPGPNHIDQMAKDGIRTIINLRGGHEHGSWPLQKEACERHGIDLVEFVLRSREVPDRETLLALPGILDGLAYPALAHCKSGADRAGLFAALYLLVREGTSVAEAKRQLSLQYGHVRLAKTGVLDAFLEAYERDGEAKGIAFLDWVRDVYDPAQVQASFHEGFWASLLIDKLLRRE